MQTSNIHPPSFFLFLPVFLPFTCVYSFVKFSYLLFLLLSSMPFLSSSLSFMSSLPSFLPVFFFFQFFFLSFLSFLSSWLSTCNNSLKERNGGIVVDKNVGDNFWVHISKVEDWLYIFQDGEWVQSLRVGKVAPERLRILCYVNDERDV